MKYSLMRRKRLFGISSARKTRMSILLLFFLFYVAISAAFVGTVGQTICSILFADANFKINIVKYNKRALQWDHHG